MNDAQGNAGNAATGKKSMADVEFDLKRFHESMARGLRWAAILRFRPDLADKCDWSKFDGTAWRLFLDRQPGFADRCDWSKLDGGDWALILEDHPEFADRCDPKKLGMTALVLIVLNRPKLAEWLQVSEIDWSRLNLAMLQPEAHLSSEKENLLWAIFGEGFGGPSGYLTQFAEQFPQYAAKCDWEKLADRG